MQMNEEQALGIIEEMIAGAKREIHDNGFYYLLWGYLVFFSALGDYFLLISHYPQHAVIWGIMMPLGGLLTWLIKIKKKEPKKVITYVDEMRRYLLIAYVISLLVVCLIMPMSSQHWRSFFPVLMVLYAFCLYTMGGIIRFKPLQYGACLVWLCSIASFFLGYDWQLLVLSMAVLGGFILPGHLLKRRSSVHV